MIMNEYISRQDVWKLISELQKFYEEERETAEDCEEESMYVGSINALTAMEDGLSDIPAADVLPVVYGEWVKNEKQDKESISCCSACGYPVSPFWAESNFCPNCGARMKGGGGR